MHCFRLLFAAVLLSAPTTALAQGQPAPAKVEYFDANRQKLPTEAGAVERSETTFRDSVSGVVRTFFLPSGKLKAYIPYASLRKRIRHGTSSHYYENGQLRLQETFVAGKWSGDLVTYYPEGQLKRRDHHAPGQPTTGECFGPDGQPVPYIKYEIMPVYSEGTGDQAAVVRAVMMSARYPAAALRSRVYGKVKIEFVVDKNGHVANVHPQEPPAGAVPPELTDAYQALQEAAASAVRNLKKFKPGKQDGEPVSVSYTVPVTFSIQ